MAAPDAPFARALYPPSHDKGPVPDGPDVVGLKRGLWRAGYWTPPPHDDSYSEKFAMEGVRPYQQASGLTATGNYGEPTHTKLELTHRKDHPDEWAFGAVEIQLFEEADQKFNKTPEDLVLENMRKMLAFCRLFDGPYVFGGEHDWSFADDDVHDGFDCSSSTSFVLYKFGLLGDNKAHVSGWFESWGLSGRGKYLTIHAADDHVWMEFNLPEGYFRFDTSPHGDGVHGPRVRSRRRSDSRFVHRHYKGT